ALLTGDELGLDRQLLDGPLDGLTGQLGVGVRELEEDPARLHDGHPALRVALAGTHAGLGRLLGDGLVGEHGDPDLAAAAGLSGHRDTRGLDLAGRAPARLEGLDAVVAEDDLGATLGLALPATALVLAMLDLLGHQHQSASPGWNLGVSWCSWVRRSISSSSARRRSSSG